MKAGKTAYRCRCGREIEGARPGETVACPDCGIKFAIENGCAKFKILPEISEDEFVRAAWIHIAKADVPLDVFKCELSAVETVVHRVAVDTLKKKISYRAFPSFAENEFAESECTVESSACAECGKGELLKISANAEGAGLGEEEEKELIEVAFDRDEYLAHIEKTQAGSFVAPDAEERERMTMTQASRWETDAKHDDDMDEALDAILCDGAYRYVEHVTETMESSTQIFAVPEYRTALSCEGKTYTVSALPFGDMEIRSEKIENDMGVDAFKKRRREKLAVEREKIEESSCMEKSLLPDVNSYAIIAAVLWGILIFGAIAVGLVLGLGFNVYGRSFNPDVINLVAICVLGAIFIAAVVISIVNGVRAYKTAMKTDPSERDSPRTKDELWRLSKSLTVAAIVLWSVFVVGEIAFVSFLFYLVWGRDTLSWLLGECAYFYAAILITAIVLTVNGIRFYRAAYRIDLKVEELFKSKAEDARSDTEAFAEEQRREILDALNEKLSSLGMESAETADLERTDLEN